MSIVSSQNLSSPDLRVTAIDLPDNMPSVAVEEIFSPGDSPEKEFHSDTNQLLTNIAQSLGFVSVSVRSYQALEPLQHNVEDSLSLDTVPGVHSFVSGDAEWFATMAREISDRVDQTSQSRVHRALLRMETVHADHAINIQALNTRNIKNEAGESASNELIPCLDGEAQQTQLPPNSAVSLLYAVDRSLQGKQLLLSGAAATDDQFGDPNDNIAQFIVRGGKIAEFSYLAKGHGEESNAMTLQPKVHITTPNSILTQVGVYQRIDQTAAIENQLARPCIVKLEGEITPETLKDVAIGLGFGKNRPYAFQLYTDGEVSGRVVQGYPKHGTMHLQDAVQENFTSATWQGRPSFAQGLSGPTPYTQNGHLHIRSFDGEKGAHLLGVKGEVVLAIHPLQYFVTGCFDPYKPTLQSE